jgi:hypothetical protein
MPVMLRLRTRYVTPRVLCTIVYLPHGSVPSTQGSPRSEIFIFLTAAFLFLPPHPTRARRDGTERVSVEDGCTLKDLRFVIQQTFGVPTQDQTLSLQQELLLSKGDYIAEFVDLHAGRKNDGKKLKALGIEHGGFVYLRYSVSREPTPTHAAQHRQELRGGKQTVNGMIAAQTRIERQEHAKCASVSFDQVRISHPTWSASAIAHTRTRRDYSL